MVPTVRMSRISKIVMAENSILTPGQQNKLTLAEQLAKQVSTLKKAPPLKHNTTGTQEPERKSVMFTLAAGIKKSMKARMTKKVDSDDMESDDGNSSSSSGSSDGFT